ncbi:MAG: 4Fe-4S binding protein [Spirochaetes bacterium]|nr:4Fe-4S binding protein [Spirochaetota bacterium]
MTVYSYLVSFFIPFVAGAAFFSLRSLNEGESKRSGQRKTPGWNCGRCGHPTCARFVEAVASNEPVWGACPFDEGFGRGKPGDGAVPEKTAVVRCSGVEGAAAPSYTYTGQRRCRVAIVYFDGHRVCPDACLGFGDCAEACPNGAIRIEDGIAVVVPERCTACGICVSSCPKLLIDIVPLDSRFIACRSRAPASKKRLSCSAGCDACRICEHHSMNGEFSVHDNLAAVNPSAKGEWQAISDKCPRSVIRPADRRSRRTASADTGKKDRMERQQGKASDV